RLARRLRRRRGGRRARRGRRPRLRRRVDARDLRGPRQPRSPADARVGAPHRRSALLRLEPGPGDARPPPDPGVMKQPDAKDETGSEAERRRIPGRRARDTAVFDQVAFEEAFVALTDGILLTDAAGRITSANPAAFRILGEDALLDGVFEDLLLVSGATTVQDTDHLVRRAWFPREERMGVLEIVTTPLLGGRKLHTVRDVTAQAELLRLKEEFLMEVAHELRTPIAALSASLDLVFEDALTMSREELQTLAGTLRRSALRLEHLVENPLDAASIEAGTFQVRVLPTSLRQTLSDMLALVQPMLDAKAQRLQIELDAGADHVLADPRRTTQVFANLITNASKYAPEGTPVTIRTVTAGGFVRVTVAAVNRDHPDLVILDINLPKLAGFVVLERIRHVDEHVAVLMLSARQDESDVLRGLQLGADDYITKPFRPKELVARVKAILRR